jgi:hypothetical protein
MKTFALVFPVVLGPILLSYFGTGAEGQGYVKFFSDTDCTKSDGAGMTLTPGLCLNTNRIGGISDLYQYAQMGSLSSTSPTMNRVGNLLSRLPHAVELWAAVYLSPVELSLTLLPLFALEALLPLR